MAAQTQTQASAHSFKSSRSLILIAGAILVFVFTYVLAWWDAYRLSSTYMEDANASYADGRYLDALLGYETYDDAKGQYVQHGGYTYVQRIWSNDRAFPVPDDAERAQKAIDEIVYDRLSIDEAEQFVQENIGRSNPYLSMIYLRLGELYEEDGQFRDAEDIYESIPDLFPQEAALIERARQDLERLQQNPEAG